MPHLSILQAKVQEECGGEDKSRTALRTTSKPQKPVPNCLWARGQFSGRKVFTKKITYTDFVFVYVKVIGGGEGN